MVTLVWVLLGLDGLAGAVTLLAAGVLCSVFQSSPSESDRWIGWGILAIGLAWASIPAAAWYLALRAQRPIPALILLALHLVVSIALTIFLLGGAEAAARP